MRRRHHNPRRKQLVAGLILITIGVMFFLDQMNVARFGHVVRDFWPLFILIPGIIKLLDSEDRSGAVWMIGIGSWLFVANLGLWGLNWGNSWPLILIAFGACIMVEGFFPNARKSNRDDEESSDQGTDL